MNIKDNCSKKEKAEVALGASHTIKKAMATILPLCFVSLFFSAAIASIANDMYAFVKNDRTVTITLDNACSVDDMAKILGDNGVVNNPDIFKYYVKLKEKSDVVENFTGQVVLNTSMSYREILSEFS